jgi:three-Cys-motif partner protein
MSKADGRFTVVGGSGTSVAAPDHIDAHRPVELHRQTYHKLEVIRRYDPVFGTIMASTDWRGRKPHIFFVDTHGGGGQHASIEREWTHGTPVLACFAARHIQRRVKGAEVHVRAVESDSAAAHLLRQSVQRFAHARGVDHVDVRVIEGDYKDHVKALFDEVKAHRGASRWLVDPRGIDIPHWTLEPILQSLWGVEVIINLDAGGALRAAFQQKAKGGLNQRADLQSLLYADAPHQSAVGELFGDRTWRDALVEEATWNENLGFFARAYAETFRPAFQFRNTYRLRSSDNQIRYLVHLARHGKGVAKFSEAFEASKHDGLFAQNLDGAGRSAVAAALFALHKGTQTTLDRLQEEHGDRYERRQLRGICEAADQDLYGQFDPTTDTVTWFTKRGKPTQTSLMGLLESE